MILILVNTLYLNKKIILVNIFDMNKKYLYEKDIKNNNNNNHLQLHKKIGKKLKILKVSDQTYLTTSVVIIFKFV